MIRYSGRIDPGSGAGPAGQLGGACPRESAPLDVIAARVVRSGGIGVAGLAGAGALVRIGTGATGRGASPATAGSRSRETSPATASARMPSRAARDRRMAENCTVLTDSSG